MLVLDMTAQTPVRDEHGRFVKTSTDTTYSSDPITKEESDAQISTYNITKKRTDPPLLFLRISNPITYIKRWWKRILGNEGLELRLRIKPLTAIAIALAFGLFGFGVGRVSIPFDSPIVKYIPQFAPTPTINPWRETAFSGILRLTNNEFYLFTTESEALLLKIPDNVDMVNYSGKRVLVKGLFNESQRILAIKIPEDIELLATKPQKIPTLVPSPSPTPTKEALPSPEEPFPNPILDNSSM